MIDPLQLIGMLKERRNNSASWRQTAMTNRDVYNGDFSVPLPELDENEQVAVANLLQQGLDQIAMRTTSVPPTPVYFPTRIGFKKAEDDARTRRSVTLDWWDSNHMKSKLRQRARWLFGYGKAPVSLYPSNDGTPRWRLLDPLHTYEAPSLDPDSMIPPDCIYSYKRSREWLHREYPDEYARLRKSQDISTFEFLEYTSWEEMVLLVIGSGDPAYEQGTPFEVLHRVENRAGIPLSVIPGRIGLDRVIGQFDGMVGMYQLQAKLMALYTIGVQRAIFGETWLVGNDPLMPPKIEVPADGQRGRVGQVSRGTMQVIQPQPGALTPSLLDRLEYAERQSGGVPPELGGSSQANVRTGRRGDSILAAAIDFRIQEAQEQFEMSLVEENKIAIALAKAYGGSRQFSLYSKTEGQIKYTPDRLFETDIHEVHYPYAGADANTLDIRVAQKIGTGTLSKQSGMEMDPLVRDFESEHDRINAEAIDQAFLTSVQTLASSPESPLLPSDFARMTRLVRENRMEIYEAFETVNEEVKARQAQAAQQAQAAMGPGGPGGGPGGPPGMGGGPETGQPGLDASSPERMAAIQAPSPSQNHLNFLLSGLRNSGRPLGPPPGG